MEPDRFRGTKVFDRLMICGFILRDACKSALLRMRFPILMVRNAAAPRVSNHEATRMFNHEQTSEIS
jgi:hypothetical protein